MISIEELINNKISKQIKYDFTNMGKIINTFNLE